MNEQPPETAHAAAGAPPTRNGADPLTRPEIARDLRLTLRAVEEVDMRLRSVQIGIALTIALSLILIGLELQELRR